MVRPLIIIALTASTAFGSNRYCRTGYCAPSYKAAAVVQQVAYPQTIIQNQFLAAAPYAQQYPLTDAAYTMAVAEEIKHTQQLLSDQISTLSQMQARPQMLIVYPQVQVQQQTAAYAEGSHCAPGQQPNGQTAFSMQQSQSVLTSCIKCHGPTGKAREHFDLTKPLTCEDRENALEAVAAGEMPKGGQPFSREELRALKLELRGYNQKNNWADPDQPEAPGNQAEQPEQPQQQPAEDVPPPPTPPQDGAKGGDFSKYLFQKPFPLSRR